MRHHAVLLLLLVLLSTAVAAHAQESEQTVVAPEIFDRAVDALNSDRFDQAVTDFSLFILMNPTSGRAYYARGVSYNARGNLDLALDDLTTALQFTEGMSDINIAVYLRRGALLTEAGRIEEAIADYDQALLIEPSADVYAGRASAYLEGLQYEAAISDLDEAIALTEDNPFLYFYRATAKSALEDDANAAGDFLQWVIRIQEQTSEQSLLEPGTPLTLDLERSLVYSIPFHGEAGQVINVGAVNVSDADPLIVLVDSEGNPLIGNDGTRAGDTSAIIRNYEIPSEGSYTLYVTHAVTSFTGRVVVLLEAE